MYVLSGINNMDTITAALYTGENAARLALDRD
jgi:hypothetical protein